MRGTIAAVLLLLGVALLAKGRWDERVSIEKSLRASVAAHALRIEQVNGIHIGYGKPADFWVPPFTAEDVLPSWVAITPAEPRDVAFALDGIEAALRQYPPGFARKLIKAVFIGGELRMQGELAAGTVGYEWVVISARPDYGPQGLRMVGFLTLHHELSSFVLRADTRTLPKWVEFAPPGWHYEETPLGALRYDLTKVPPLETGFINAYGATNLENDFNMYVEEMFSNPARVARLAAEHPIVRRKVDFVIETYAALDPRFKEVFRELGLSGS